LVIVSLFLLTSCISTKKTTYFQGDPIGKSELYRLNNEPYRLQINDVLYIDIKGSNPEIVTMFTSDGENSGGSFNKTQNLYFTGYSVDRHGNIRIPYLGDVNVLGFTEKEVREKIELNLETYFKNPEQLFVTVKLAGINIVVTGEVNSPGSINLMQNQVSIVDAISNAGEITPFGNREDITIIRKTIDGVKKYKLDYTKIDIFDSENFYLQPNDIVYVAPLKQKSWGTGTTGFQSFTTVVTILSFLVSSVLLVKNL
jgi:polysaccharide export outer membrane protein